MGIRVSVVIPAYERAEWLKKCVLSLRSQTLSPAEFAVFVVDSSPNEVNEKSMRELAAIVPFPLKCIRKKPEGPGPSRTLGGQQNDSPFIAFLDSDCYVTPGWLEAGLRVFEGNIGIVQGRVLPDPEQPTKVFTHYLRIEKESHFYETANIFYRRETFEECGGFPADVMPNAERPVGGEDTEAAWTAKRLGWRTAFAPEALVYHEVRPINIWDWIFNKRLFRIPGLVGRFPELRRFMFGKYFYDQAQGYLLLALFGLALSILNPLGAALAIPYTFHRAMGRSGTLTGILRIVRVAAYFLQDSATLLILLGGSVRYRALLL